VQIVLVLGGGSFFLTKKKPKTVTRRGSTVVLPGSVVCYLVTTTVIKLWKIKASIHSTTGTWPGSVLYLPYNQNKERTGTFKTKYSTRVRILVVE
jgi:hypothetical protein